MTTNSLCSISAAFAAAALAFSTARAQQPVDSTNRQLAALVQQDQAEARALVKAGPHEEDWRRWVAASAPRRELVRQLIRSGGLVTAEDYANGALLLQHGESPEDFMLSHVLGTVAGFKGSRNGRFLSAVSLDRYLLNVGQPQVFGSQAMADFTKMETAFYSMAPNLAIVTDQIRKEFAYPLTAAEIEGKNQAHNDSLARAGALPPKPAATCALQGTWRLESVRFVQGATDTGRAIPIDGVQLKVINATHFTYIRQLGDSQTVDMSGRKAAVVGSHVTGGAGTYTLEGDELHGTTGDRGAAQFRRECHSRHLPSRRRSLASLVRYSEWPGRISRIVPSRQSAVNESCERRAPSPLSRELRGSASSS